MSWWGNAKTSNTENPKGPVKSASKCDDGEIRDQNRNETNVIRSRSRSSNHCKDNAGDDNNNDDSGSLSSLSFYEDFPRLCFAVRRGRYVNNSVFLTWDLARRQIVGYPEAEYIATPTLLQAHSYTNGFGEFNETIDRLNCDSSKGEKDVQIVKDVKDVKRQSPSSSLSPVVPKKQKILFPAPLTIPKGKWKKKNSKDYTTRSLLLEYYELYDPGYKGKGKDPLTIQKFMRERKMYKSKFRIFVKHWQRSGLLIMSNEEKPLKAAIYKYDTWVKDRKLERDGCDGGNDDEDERNQKQKRPVMLLDGTSGNKKYIDSPPPFSRTRNPPTKKRKKKSPATPSPQTKRKIKKATIRKKSTDNNRVVSASVLQTATIVDSFRRTAATTRPYAKHTSEDDDDKDDNDVLWNEMYRKAKVFHGLRGHVKVPKSYDQKLSYWVYYNRRRMRPEATRSGARALTQREEKLLNDLDFDPVYKEIVNEFSTYIGMRVAKLFDVLVDDSSPPLSGEKEDDSGAIKSKKPRIQKKPFFGTVGRISSVSNRYLRIKYDDGDSEDFDKACLLRGLTMYNKYKHKDIVGDVASTVPPIPPAASTAPTVAPVPAPVLPTALTATFPAGNANKNHINGDNENGNINKFSSHSNGIIFSSDTNQNQMNNPTTKFYNPHGKNDSRSDSIRNNNGDTNTNNSLAAIAHQYNTRDNYDIGINIGLRDVEKIATANLDHQTNALENDATTPRRNQNGTAENEGVSDGYNINNNAIDGTSSSDDEVEVVEVLIPYRGNPNLFEDPQSGGGDDTTDRDNRNNTYNASEEGLYEY